MFVGIDSHKDSLAACVVHTSGTRGPLCCVPKIPRPATANCSPVARQTGTLERIEIEGSANLGAGLARALTAEGQTVREVPCEMTVRERRRLRRPGKSDPADALAIARVMRSGGNASSGSPSRVHRSSQGSSRLP